MNASQMFSILNLFSKKTPDEKRIAGLYKIYDKEVKESIKLLRKL